MPTSTSPLAQPLTLPCGAVLRNRIAKSAMSEDLADVGNIPGERLFRVYQRWGAGGAGLLISGNIMVDRAALGEPGNVAVESDADLSALTKLAQSATMDAFGHPTGTAMWAQINHPGRQAPRFLVPKPVAPSAVPLTLPGAIFAAPRALTAEEIPAIIARFARTAALCKRAGYTGVQIHAAHGYLVSQFLSPLSNLRDDAWGGDAVRRRRFLVEIVRAIRAAVGPAFPIGVKLNSADFQRGGFDEEESMDVVAALEAEGIDLLEISGGTYEKPATSGTIEATRASTLAREAYFLTYARKVRTHTRLPLLLTGGFRSRSGMESALSEQVGTQADERAGAVDMIGLARPFALEPEIARGLLDGTVTESRVQPRRTGVNQIDGFLEITWYTFQIHRIGAGKDPLPDVSPWRVFADMGSRTLFRTRR